MKNIYLLFKRFIPKYKKYVIWNFLFNLLATVFNLFSFAAIIPILQILFGMNVSRHSFIDLAGVHGLKEFGSAIQNNAYYYIEHLITSFGGERALLFLGLFLIITTILQVGFTYSASASLVPLRTGILRDLRNLVYRKMISLPLSYFSEERKGDLMSRTTNDIVEIEASITSSLDMIFKNPITLLIYFSVLVALSWKMTIFVLILLPTSGWIIGKIGRSLKKKSLLGQQLSGELLSQIEETLGGLRIIKAFNAEGRLTDRYAGLNERIRNTFRRIDNRYLLAHPISQLLGTVVIALLLYFGGILILDGKSTFSAPEFIYYLVIFYSMIQPFKDLSKASYSVQKGMASLQRVDEILNAKNTMITDSLNLPIKSFNDKIELNDVWFKYKEAWVLRNVNLTVEKGRTVALVGQSGSGKSTIVDLLSRFYDVQEGRITIDGINIKDLNVRDLRDLMGNVNQEAILFNDTFYNNITFGTDATMEEVIAAAKIANAHDFIMATEKGYETNVGDRGGRLSGGQRQRISIARAILKNPPILILDEATSALDTESEKLVQQAIDHLMKNRTTIVIAHRLSTIKNSDEICVVQDGEIVERGTHEDLIKQKGYYKHLCDMQST